MLQLQCNWAELQRTLPGCAWEPVRRIMAVSWIQLGSLQALNNRCVCVRHTCLPEGVRGYRL